MTTKSNLVAPGVPILGQPEPTPYPLAGHVLGFTLSPDDVADVHRSAIQQGLQPDAGFVLLWQRCSMAVARLEAQVRDLNDRVKALEQLESREVITDAAGPLAVAVLPLAQLVYRRHAAGCCLHVVLDDGNVDDDSVDICKVYARQRGHTACEILAEVISTMSIDERTKLHQSSGYDPKEVKNNG